MIAGSSYGEVRFPVGLWKLRCEIWLVEEPESRSKFPDFRFSRVVLVSVRSGRLRNKGRLARARPDRVAVVVFAVVERSSPFI